ncbi:MAG: small subunit ribosomal protein S18 [Acidimicrobiales bacterium]|jgi:small subunit ribosomal protein S18
MAKAKSTRRAKPKDNGRRGKPKISPINSDGIEFVDYKDVDLLRRFLSDRAKIRGRHASGNDSQQQRVVSVAIKNAREMGLLPYASQVTTQRRGRNDRGERGDRGDRGDRGPRRDSEERPDNESTEGTEEAVVLTDTDAVTTEQAPVEQPVEAVAAEGDV